MRRRLVARLAGASRHGLFLLALLLALAGPAAAQDWFEDYEAGVAALRKGDARRAASLLERAARKHPEPGDDVLTYGTNRLTHYHPYLQLAQAKLALGDVPGAREALERSKQKGREPAGDRARLEAAVEAIEQKARAVAEPTSTTVALPPPTTTLLAAVIQPPPPVPAVTQPQPPPTTVASAVTRKAPPVASPAPAAAPPRAVATPPTLPLPVSTPAPPDSLPREVAITATLVVVSQPGGATVYVDDELAGVTDPASGRLVKSGLTQGEHRVRVAFAGRSESSQVVQVERSGTLTVNAALAAPAAEGRSWLGPVVGIVVLLLAGLGWHVVSRRTQAPVPAPVTGVVTLQPAGTQATPTRAVSQAPTAHSAPTVSGGDETSSLGTVAAPRGDTFGDYRLVKLLGKGGMATVHEAERRGEHVALKRPLASFLDDAEFLQRFLREAEIGRTLHHPNIIRIFERGEVAGVPYFTMELIHGQTLHTHLHRDGPMPPRRAASLVAQAAEALDYAHLKGVVHRDLKPSNIMLLADGVVKVMDYGIARARRFDGLTVTGAFLGTPDYIAPETAEGKGTDARSDLYSLGVVFYEMLTGAKPFVGETPFATLRMHCVEPPRPPSLIVPSTPPEVEAVVLKLLAKEPQGRFADAEELLLALRDYLNRAA